MSLKELAALAGLSSPSTAERVRRLEEKGVIRGYGAEIDPESLGFMMQAMVRIKSLPGKMHLTQQRIQEIDAIGECDKVTGDDCFIARLYVRSVGELETVLDRLADHAETSTSIVKSQPIKRRPPPLE